MLKKVEIKDPGDSTYLPGEVMDKNVFENVNEKLELEKKQNLFSKI